VTRLAELGVDGRDDVMVATLSGELDLSNVRDLTDALGQAVPAEALGLVIDMSDLRHIDSAGLRMVFDVRRRLGQRRQELVLAVPPGARIRDVLELAAVEQTVGVVADVDAAVAAVRDASRG
jgi:anti-anti-sigma factor